MNEYAKKHSHADLLLHARRVAKFGGRDVSDAKIKNAILSANLGGSHVYDTTASTPSDKVVVLCEMSLPRAIPVDLVFSIPNRRIDPDGGARLADDPATDGFDPLDTGSGFVRVTWGSPGGSSQVVDVDAGRGWRYPFVASYLSAEYHPVDRTQFVGTPSKTNMALPGGQPRDMKVQASIIPGGSAAPVAPLIKTMFYPDIGALGQTQMLVPDFAQKANVDFAIAITNPAISFEWLSADSLSILGGSRANASSAQWPSYLVKMELLPPQRAAFLRILSTSGATFLGDLTVRYTLAV